MFFNVRPPPQTPPPPRRGITPPRMPSVVSLDPYILELRRSVDQLLQARDVNELNDHLVIIDLHIQLLKKKINK